MNTNILSTMVAFLIIGCFVYFILHFLKMLFGISRAVGEGNKEAKVARAQRQAALRNMSVENLRNFLKNDKYLNGLKQTLALKSFFKDIEGNNEKEILKRLNENGLYRLLVRAEHENGHKGRPEAIDNVVEIWDILKELSVRSKILGTRTN